MDANPDFPTLLKVGRQAAQEAGAVISRGFHDLSALQVRRKGENDFVTRVDEEAEGVIRGVLSANFPRQRILAEEGGYSGADGEFLWVIDPLDGTTNFIHGIPHFAVSLALLRKGEVVFGLIFNPLTEDCFHAALGRGAFLNGRPIAASATAELGMALGATGFPFKAPDQRPAYAGAFAALLSRCKDMRRCGSAALDLAYTACGRFDFFWEAHLLPWDFLAGKLLVSEAGGLSGDFAGGELSVRTSSVLAANRFLYPTLLKQVGEFFSRSRPPFYSSR